MAHLYKAFKSCVKIQDPQVKYGPPASRQLYTAFLNCFRDKPQIYIPPLLFFFFKSPKSFPTPISSHPCQHLCGPSEIYMGQQMGPVHGFMLAPCEFFSSAGERTWAQNRGLTRVSPCQTTQVNPKWVTISYEAPFFLMPPGWRMDVEKKQASQEEKNKMLLW